MPFMNIAPILFIAGTRAEALKLVLLYKQLKNYFPVLLCSTYQHTTLVDDVFNLFNVRPDFSLNVMKENQDLFHLTTAILTKTNELYQEVKPSLVVVHGDTTTTMASSLSAFYNKIPIAHIEAGLRTGNMQWPFPEELNRKIVGQCATYHFAPTARAMAHLFAEGVAHDRVFCVGNTIVDSLFYIKQKIADRSLPISSSLRLHVEEWLTHKKKLFLLTAHRRESFNGGLLRIFTTVKKFVTQHPDIKVIFPYHPNPNVIKAITQAALHEEPRIVLMQALPYHELVYVLMHAHTVITDSGGIQEEAVTLGKHVVCVRDVTERNEGVWEGNVVLVGTDPERITKALVHAYHEPLQYRPSFVYGDGKADERIISIIKSVIFPNYFKGEMPARKRNEMRQSL